MQKALLEKDMVEIGILIAMMAGIVEEVVVEVIVKMTGEHIMSQLFISVLLSEKIQLQQAQQYLVF